MAVATRGPGSAVDATTLLYEQPRSASVLAKGAEPAVLWRLCRRDFSDVMSTLGEGSDEEDEDEEEEDDVCVVDLNNMRSIFVVSDGTGQTCAQSVGLALQQFDFCYQGAHGYSLSQFAHVREEEEVLEIVRRAREEDALIVYTLMQPTVREVMRAELAREATSSEGPVRALDLWEPMLVELEDLLGARRRPEVSSVARRRQPVSDTLLRMMDAIEYAQKMDDGVKPELWGEADIVLIGLSRAGKTPLAFFLAQLGYKVANYPVVPDEEPPEHLFDPAIQDRCVSLTIAPDRLQKVRNERMKEYGRVGAQYSTLATCATEVSWLRSFHARRGRHWPMVDTTNGGVEENANKILKALRLK